MTLVGPERRGSGTTEEIYDGIDACILVFDVTTARTFENIESWREEFLVEAGLAERSAGFPIILLGNKIDMEDDMRVVHPKEVLAWCAAHKNLPYFEVSAKENLNVEQPFTFIVRQVMKKRLRKE